QRLGLAPVEGLVAAGWAREPGRGVDRPLADRILEDRIVRMLDDRCEHLHVVAETATADLHRVDVDRVLERQVDAEAVVLVRVHHRSDVRAHDDRPGARGGATPDERSGERAAHERPAKSRRRRRVEECAQTVRTIRAIPGEPKAASKSGWRFSSTVVKPTRSYAVCAGVLPMR